MVIRSVPFARMHPVYCSIWFSEHCHCRRPGWEVRPLCHYSEIDLIGLVLMLLSSLKECRPGVSSYCHVWNTWNAASTGAALIRWMEEKWWSRSVSAFCKLKPQHLDSISTILQLHFPLFLCIYIYIHTDDRLYKCIFIVYLSIVSFFGADVITKENKLIAPILPTTEGRSCMVYTETKGSIYKKNNLCVSRAKIQFIFSLISFFSFYFLFYFLFHKHFSCLEECQISRVASSDQVKTGEKQDVVLHAIVVRTDHANATGQGPGPDPDPIFQIWLGPFFFYFKINNNHD